MNGKRSIGVTSHSALFLIDLLIDTRNNCADGGGIDEATSVLFP